MPTHRQTKQRGLGVVWGALLLAISGVSVSHAQDSVENTPPELRDFRLDPPPRQTAPQPETPVPTEQPPATPPTAAPTPVPVERQRSPAVEETQRTVPAPAAVGTADAPTAETQLPSAESAPTPERAPTASETQRHTEALTLPETKNFGLPEIAGMLGLLLAIASGVFVIWRRRTVAPAAASASRRQTREHAPARLAHAPTPFPRPAPLAPPAPELPPSSAISIAFAPEKAVLSFSSLTVEGHLHVTNAGAVAADDLELQALLISASKEQQSAIESFFAPTGSVRPSSPLGAVKPGENIRLPLKLSVALNEMQTFSVQDKTLLAPILLAKLTRCSPDGTAQEVARLVCMIGREATSPQPKMGPLRLDLGPRSFNRLGQRAVLS